MRYAILYLLCLLSHVAIAQGKFRLVDTSNRWVLEHVGGANPGEYFQEIFTYGMGGDTIINHHTYKKVVFPNVPPGVSVGVDNGARYIGQFFREDTLNNRVYCIRDLRQDSMEQLVYDGGWVVGDTIHWHDGLYYQGKSTVVGIDSVMIDSNWYKVFEMNATNTAESRYYIIEGIGSTAGTAFPAMSYTFENRPQLRCFSHAGRTPPLPRRFGYVFDNSSSCTITLLGVGSPAVVTTPALLVLPNPGGHDAVLELRNHGGGTVTVMDEIGRIVLRRPISDSSRSLAIGRHLSAPGYYYCLLLTDDGSRYFCKFDFRP
jgi:hypothetical protein